MSKDAVIFKGTKHGILVKMSKMYTFDVIKYELTEKLRASGDFFDGANVVLGLDGRDLNDNEIKEVEDIINKNTGVANLKILKQHDIERMGDQEGENSIAPVRDRKDVFEEGKVKIIRGTIRNGQRISFDGNIVVIGDVNPGGEIIASGNIMIMGLFRGIAHAGVDGNRDCFVAAYYLQPTQLRISNVIARCPDNSNLSVKPDCPEIAYINEDGALVIESYQSWKICTHPSKA
ncbi:MAG: septum site-determining protein MinC [Clostridia bacterium]|nr:septum site-determining protein MinC [Clostridia bacterium]